MPYVKEEQGENSVSLNHQAGEDSEDYAEEQEEYHQVHQEPRRSVGLVIQRGGVGNPVRTFSVVNSSNSNPSTATTASQLALLQRRAAQRKLQMAKMMGNGGMGSPMNMIVSYHGNNSQADDSRHDRQNDAMYVASRRARSNNFTLKETFDLLKIWASPEMQWQMKHNFRNFRVWEAISYSMHEMGHDRTAIQCKNRIQNLTSIFYRIKKSKQDYRSFNFPYYKLIGEVLDGKKNGTAAMAGAIELSPALAKFATNYTGGGSGGNGMNSTHASGNSNSGRMAAHMALVEEYQHLINGNPETNITSFTERNSSSNGSSNMNVLSPEVSLSEGNSPIRVEAQASGSRSSAAKPTQNTSPISKTNGIASMSFVNRNGRSSTTNVGGSMKLEPEDNVTITVEDGSLPSEHGEDIEASDYDESYMGTGDESPSGRNGGLPGVRPKRSFSSSFNPYMKSEYSRLGGNAAKRPRVASTATNASSSMDDPIGQYLAEMVDIERQWLEMERERAENERAMMMYMMQILQAIVCPNQSQDEDADGDDEGNDAENDGRTTDDTAEDNEFAESTEQDQDQDQDQTEDNEIRQMIEQEENENQEAPPNGEQENENE